MHGIVGGIEVQDDDLALARDGRHAVLQQQRLDLVSVSGDFLGAQVRAMSAQLQTVERALASQRPALVLREVAILAEHIRATAHGGEQRIEAQRVVVIDVLVAQGDAEDALAQHDGEIMLDEAALAPVGEAGGELLAEALGAIHLAQPQAAPVAGEVSAGKISLHTAASQPLKLKSLLITLCCRLSRVHGGR